MKKKSKAPKRTRSAVTGLYVSHEFAQANPNTTVGESTRKRSKAK